MNLDQWLRYEDRINAHFNPFHGAEINLVDFHVQEDGSFDQPTWRKEEWLIRSAITPVHDAALVAELARSPDYLEFEQGWSCADKFDFGNHRRLGDAVIYPISDIFLHPISKILAVSPSKDFCRYHALEEREAGKYYHPVAEILVAQCSVVEHTIFDPTPKVVIHRDFLRDFLSAGEMSLIISVVVNRFANSEAEADLGIMQNDEIQPEEHESICTSIQSPETTHGKFFRGRSILLRTLIVDPCDEPRYDRSPWYFSRIEHPIEHQELPLFIVDDEGTKKKLLPSGDLNAYMRNGIGQYGYLWFRAEVLRKYLNTPRYSIYFCMRNWGQASLPGERGEIDVGINSLGLVTAFAPDIAQLPAEEQAYWASFSSYPSGEVCEELFQTRMQCNPPLSPSTTELIREARDCLGAVVESRFGVELFDTNEPSEKERAMLSVGPLLNDFSEVATLAKILYKWIFETMSIPALRTVCLTLGQEVDSKLRQIKLLEKGLILIGLSIEESRGLTAPFAGLYDLRIVDAHIGSIDIDASMSLMGGSSQTQARGAWGLCVDSVTRNLNEIAAQFRTNQPSENPDSEDGC
ncbi:hypothetical protein [Synechococcus sp. BO 8801]|uniref:hypothetical protein n=1 Tax=Synechococcus sp. BO 8801 TaxID=169670 RepID=UPI00117DACB2|nr:hypothetical protein [Synechococcus sp. BO 8801]